ncbi:S1 family peptidase [Actinotalea sp. M2MS4P-6]|uniref:S1 family peptidase n=1 Tax=Actinotalea sp. M2MS4P-6 TaxID=2983762 RepID=UPI0021E46643|nr:S1 family peptidase [Actinotalea sp. M2MS4P-6]MCV2396038.1 S1 family peptidase [Actinotalea sp. M2MS4P-6]
MRKKLLAAAAAVATLATTMAVGPSAYAVTDGELDGDGHPEVVLILMEVDGTPAYRCSGTMIAPTYVLTAGHCAGAPGEFSGMRIFTESDVEAGIGVTNNYPFGGGDYSIEAVRWAAHPDYPDYPFFMNDVGMIELAEPYDPGVFGTLPAVDSLDQYKTKRGLNPLTFTSVGYGLQQSFPDAAYWLASNTRTRYVAHPRLIQINTPGFTGDFSMLLSNNANTGGTCFGDSGGANFLGDTTIVAGITSFGLNSTCGGTGGVFRTDRQNVQDFINDFMNP